MDTKNDRALKCAMTVCCASTAAGSIAAAAVSTNVTPPTESAAMSVSAATAAGSRIASEARSRRPMSGHPATDHATRAPMPCATK